MGVINLGALVEKLKKKLSGSGFITKTDYASGDNGGVIKIDSTYATDITSGGKLKAKAITAEAYSEANNGAFISKETLDNLIAAGTFGGGGVTCESAWSVNAVPGSSTKITPVKPFGDYKVLIALVEGDSASKTVFASLIPTALIGTWYITLADSSVIIINKVSGDYYINRYSGTYNKSMKIYGLK